MAETLPSKNFKHIILTALKNTLKPKGFKKHGNIFSNSNGDLTYFIGLQSSLGSTANIVKATINIEIASSVLCKLEEISIPEHLRRHYTERIGFFMEKPHDKWWILDSIENAEKASIEIIELITTKVLPTFEKIKTTQDLAMIWREGRSPGLTEKMRAEYLRLLPPL